MIGFYMLTINPRTSHMNVLGYDVSLTLARNMDRHGASLDMEILEVSRNKAYLLEILDWLTSDKPMTDDRVQEILHRYEWIRGKQI